jgi:hypothetical protein
VEAKLSSTREMHGEVEAMLRDDEARLILFTSRLRYASAPPPTRIPRGDCSCKDTPSLAEAGCAPVLMQLSCSHVSLHARDYAAQREAAAKELADISAVTAEAAPLRLLKSICPVLGQLIESRVRFAFSAVCGPARRVPTRRFLAVPRASVRGCVSFTACLPRLWWACRRPPQPRSLTRLQRQGKSSAEFESVSTALRPVLTALAEAVRCREATYAALHAPGEADTPAGSAKATVDGLRFSWQVLDAHALRPPRAAHPAAASVDVLAGSHDATVGDAVAVEFADGDDAGDEADAASPEFVADDDAAPADKGCCVM